MDHLSREGDNPSRRRVPASRISRGFLGEQPQAAGAGSQHHPNGAQADRGRPTPAGSPARSLGRSASCPLGLQRSNQDAGLPDPSLRPRPRIPCCGSKSLRASSIRPLRLIRSGPLSHCSLRSVRKLVQCTSFALVRASSRGASRQQGVRCQATLRSHWAMWSDEDGGTRDAVSDPELQRGRMRGVHGPAVVEGGRPGAQEGVFHTGSVRALDLESVRMSIMTLVG